MLGIVHDGSAGKIAATFYSEKVRRQDAHFHTRDTFGLKSLRVNDRSIITQK
ncbi:MAG TPA: hypothetical protein VG498_03800 [Terriglobales bacterium]|nr:hypothetical protein [Terriglobales bacterium]